MNTILLNNKPVCKNFFLYYFILFLNVFANCSTLKCFFFFNWTLPSVLAKLLNYFTIKIRYYIINFLLLFFNKQKKINEPLNLLSSNFDLPPTHQVENSSTSKLHFFLSRIKSGLTFLSLEGIFV